MNESPQIIERAHRGMIHRGLRGLREALGGISGRVAWTICFIYVLVAIFADWITPHPASAIGLGDPFASFSWAHPLGLDQLGRSVLSQIIVAARIAVVAAVLSVLIGLVVGTLLGVISGYLRGFIGQLISYLFDLLFSVPPYLLGIIVVVVAGRGLVEASMAIGIALVPQFGKIARAAAMSVRESSYVESARLAGRGSWWIIRKHILPNIMTPVSVMLGLSLANAEGTYAILSYLGFGARPPTPDYGSMISAGQGYLLTDPWLVVVPSFFLVVLIVAFALLGDWASERFDPTNRAARIGVE